MKCIIGVDFGSVVFVPGSRQVILLDTPPFQLENIALIVNVTAGKILYNFADPTNSATTSYNMVQLSYDTSAMEHTDRLQVIMNFEEDQIRPLRHDVDGVTVFGDQALPMPQLEGTGEQLTYDTNLNAVFGGVPLTLDDVDGRKLRSAAYGAVRYARGKIAANGETVQINCEGMSTFSVAIVGSAFVGGVNVEGCAEDSTQWIALNGRTSLGMWLSTLTNINSSVRGSCAGMKWLRVRCSAYTSGMAGTSIQVSTAPFAHDAPIPQGSQGQPLYQRASTYELQTYDNNLAAVFGTTPMLYPNYVEAPATFNANRTAGGSQPTWVTSAPNVYTYPHILNQVRRLPALMLGSKGQPLAQEDQTNRLSVIDNDTRRLLEELLLHQKLMIELLAKGMSLDVPTWFQTDW